MSEEEIEAIDKIIVDNLVKLCKEFDIEMFVTHQRFLQLRRRLPNGQFIIFGEYTFFSATDVQK